MVCYGALRRSPTRPRFPSCPSQDAGSPTSCIAAEADVCIPALLSAVVFWMTIMPWLVRNYEVFGTPVFVRDNFGIELRIGNNPLAEGIYVLAYHPSRTRHPVCEVQADG